MLCVGEEGADRVWERLEKKLCPKLEFMPDRDKSQLHNVEYIRKQKTKARADDKHDRTLGAILAF